MRRLVLLVIAAAAAASCSSASTAAGAGPTTVNLVESDMRFSPNRIDAKVGQTVVVHVTNQGAQRHDVAFPSIEMPSLRGVETAVEPGGSATLTLTFDRPGEYQFICTIPGHFAAGMSGAAFVSP